MAVLDCSLAKRIVTRARLWKCSFADVWTPIVESEQMFMCEIESTHAVTRRYARPLKYACNAISPSESYQVLTCATMKSSPHSWAPLVTDAI